MRNQIDSLLGQLREAGHQVWVGGPQPESAVAELEATLGISLPPTYRAFLLRFGAVGVGNEVVSGVLHGQAVSHDTGWVIGDTAHFREAHDVPEYLIVVQPDEDAPSCLDASEVDSAGEWPVVNFELASRHSTRMADNFGAWVEGWLEVRAAGL